MSERWDQQMDRKLAPAKAFMSIIPLWIRIGVIAGSFALSIYLVVEDLQPYRAVSQLANSVTLGGLVTWLCVLAPCAVVLTCAATFLHRRRKKQDFPRAIVRR